VPTRASGERDSFPGLSQGVMEDELGDLAAHRAPSLVGGPLRVTAGPTMPAPVSTTRTYCPACGRIYPSDLGHCSFCPEPPRSTSPAECPRCRRPLLARSVRGVTVDACARCRGVWFDSNEIQRAIDLTVPDAPTAARTWTPLARTPVSIDPTLSLGCVRCFRKTTRVQAAPESRVWMHACREHGLWFDGPELPRFRAFVSAGGLRRAAERRVAAPTDTGVGDALSIALEFLFCVFGE